MSFLTQKLIGRKKNGKKTCFIADENSHGLRTEREKSLQTKWSVIYLFSDDFGLRSPVSQ